MLRWLRLLVVFCAAPMAQAHPHVFVEVELRILDDGKGHMTGIEVTWTYDQIFTLLLLSDQNLDPDADGKLTQAERAQLKGFDLEDWPEGFDGATFVYRGTDPVVLSVPEPMNLWIDDEGQMVTQHRRMFAPVAFKDGLRVQPYDPYYYAALRLSPDITLPEGCTSVSIAPDTEAADALVAELGWTGEEEALFEEVKVGLHYADTLEVTCAGL